MTMHIDFESINSWLALLIIGSAMVPVWLLGLKVTGNKAWPFVWGAIERVAGARLKGRAAR
jgi:hypothetical protein